MKKVGIAIDPHKLDIFKKGLTASGYTFNVTEGRTLTAIQVDVEDHLVTTEFKDLVEKLNKKCAN